MVAATIVGMYESIKVLTTIAKVTADVVVDVKVKEAIFQIREGLYELQGKALEDRAARSELQDELDTLKRELRDIKDNRAKLADYELHPLEAGKFVYKYKSEAPGTAEHFVCPDCLNSSQSVGVLQHERAGNGQTRYWCTKCSFSIFAGVVRPMKPIRYNSPF